MIIYGWRSKTLKQAPLRDIECENCKESASHLSVTSHYVHIFWIPIFPYAKRVAIACHQCGQVTKEKEMSPDFKAKIHDIKAAAPTPKYLFSGLAVLAIIVLFIVSLDYNTSQQQQDYLSSPLVGDIYVLKDNEEVSAYKYYLMKINDTEQDSLFVTYNAYSYNGIPVQLEPEDGFYDFSIKIAKSELVEMNQKGEITKVIRDYGEHEGYNRIVEYIEEEGVYEEEWYEEEAATAKEFIQ